MILIGNGFDLAHGLKTGYKDFIDDFWEKRRRCITKGINDGLKDASDKNSSYKYLNNDIIEMSIPSINAIEFKQLYDKTDKKGYAWFKQLKDYYDKGIKDNNFAKMHFDCYNAFLETISKNSELSYWNGIEAEYYNALKECLDDNGSDEKVEKLNAEFSFIKAKMENYLNEQVKTRVSKNHKIEERIYSDIKPDDFPGEQPIDRKLEKILFLNFNYTETDKLYFKKDYDYKSIHIHGELNNSRNRIIFGYGDETDNAYQRIKNKGGRYLENIKSAKYNQTKNYKDVDNFIKSSLYQIFIMGHSCGISDKDMLSKLFLNKNCISIKIFYHEESDNYGDIDGNIGRYFDTNGLKMAKLVNREDSEPLS
jgi:hypothetical protein